MKGIEILVLAFSMNAFAHFGGEGGNPGQEVALEFATIGADVTYQLMRNFRGDSDNCKNVIYADLCALDIDKLRNAVQLARVVSVPDLTRDDPDTGTKMTYVALNFPQEQRILVSESGWKNPNFCSVQKFPLVLHEYLGLLGIEIENYRYSSMLAEWLIQTATRDRFEGCPELYKGDAK